MRAARRVTGLTLVLAAVVVLALPTTAGASSLAKTGWWWRVNDGSAPVTVPPPPNVPTGGLMVAGAPDGATAIAALRFDLGEDETSPVLTLTVADNGDQGSDTAILAACVTGSAWDPASPGLWSAKPYPACDLGSVNGIRSDDKKSWTFALAPLTSDGIVDVTLVPGVDASAPAGANGSTFQLAFNPPTTTSLATTRGTQGSDFSVPDFGASDYPGSSDSFDVPASTGTFDAPPADAASFIPALPEADQGLTATAPVVQNRNAPLQASPASAVAEHRGLAALVLVLCGGTLLWSGQQPVPAPRRLGPFGTSDAARVGPAPADELVARPAGVGRFARTRTGSAPRLW